MIRLFAYCLTDNCVLIQPCLTKTPLFSTFVLRLKSTLHQLLKENNGNFGPSREICRILSK